MKGSRPRERQPGTADRPESSVDPATADTFAEPSVTYTTAPAAQGATGTVGAVSAGKWIVVPLATTVRSGQSLQIALKSTHTDSAFFGSRGEPDAPDTGADARSVSNRSITGYVTAGPRRGPAVSCRRR